jgi:hypothetical protein
MSILELKYVPPTRPYSQKELSKAHDNLFNSLRLGDNYVYFSDSCNHFYFTKEVSRNKTSPCLVCKKLKETNANLRETAERLIEEYNKRFINKPEKLSYDLIDIENVYYKWIYKN